jgi:hypothetical protein
MNLADIRKETAANKQRFWGWLTDINARQADVLLEFAKDAFEQEARRGEQIDTKGNWLLAASFAGLSLAATVAKSAVEGLASCNYSVVAFGILGVVLILTAASGFALRSVKINRSWFPPNPELILRPAILTGDGIDLERDLILHYIDNYSSNRRIDDNKAALLKRSQWFMFAALAVAVLVGMIRMFV